MRPMSSGIKIPAVAIRVSGSDESYILHYIDPTLVSPSQSATNIISTQPNPTPTLFPIYYLYSPLIPILIYIFYFFSVLRVQIPVSTPVSIILVAVRVLQPVNMVVLMAKEQGLVVPVVPMLLCCCCQTVHIFILMEVGVVEVHCFLVVVVIVRMQDKG